MIKNIVIIFFALTVFTSCKDGEKINHVLNKGNWLFELYIDSMNPEVILPFRAELFKEDSLVIYNGQEAISVNEITYRNDSVNIIMPVFGSEFKAKIYEEYISGNWYKYVYDEPYSIPFKAFNKVKFRFLGKDTANVNVEGKWKCSFINEENDTTYAIGIFKQDGYILTGTILTEIGDYRYLEGILSINKLMLSTFDGAHAFLFEANIENDSLQGFFKSGSHWTEKWIAVRDDTFVLRDMKKLTYLKEGYDRLEFEFPNEKKEQVSLNDVKYQNKVVIVQIMGTWCPNCMDETKYFTELYEKYHSKGLEIIALDFEPKSDFDYFKLRAERFKKNLNVKYEVLLAGDADKEKAAKSLPMLNHILSYPTAIFMNRQGDIVEIHTGFTGPGTGEHYLSYKKQTNKMLERLLKM